MSHDLSKVLELTSLSPGCLHRWPQETDSSDSGHQKATSSLPFFFLTYLSHEVSCELHPVESGEYSHPLHSFLNTAFTLGDGREFNLRFSQWPPMKGNSPVTWPSFPLRLLAKPVFSSMEAIAGWHTGLCLAHSLVDCLQSHRNVAPPFPPAGCACGQGDVGWTMFVSAPVSQRLCECGEVHFTVQRCFDNVDIHQGSCYVMAKDGWMPSSW